MSDNRVNPWKLTTIAMLAAIAGALAAGIVVAKVQEAPSGPSAPAETPAAEAEPMAPEAAVQPPATPVAAAAPPAPEPPRSVEDCERYRYKTRTDGGRVAKNGLIGGALGAGLGAAGGAIGGSAGKGAGIGALAGAVVGTGYTLHDEHKQKEASRRAYHACLARNG